MYDCRILMLLLCLYFCVLFFFLCCFFFQAEDGIRDLVRSRGLGDVYKRQISNRPLPNLKGLRSGPDSNCRNCRGISSPFSAGLPRLKLSLIHI